MKAIFAYSNDGFLAKDDKDDMKWTGSLDKAFFKLYTHQNPYLFCGTKTLAMMPKLSGRTITGISRKDFHEFSLRSKGCVIGGPTFLKACFDADLIDEFLVSTIKKVNLEEGLRFSSRTQTWNIHPIFNSDELEVTLYKKLGEKNE
jgi:dihydrofolate reductase